MPALCIVYSMFLAFFNRRWTAATSLETEAVGVPIGMRQKSVVCTIHLIVNRGLRWQGRKREELSMSGLVVCELGFDCVAGAFLFLS